MNKENKEQLLESIAQAGGLQPGVASQVAEKLGFPEAEVYGAGTFFHLLSEPDTKIRICTGLSCRRKGARELLDKAIQTGLPVLESTCLAACDVAPAAMKERTVLAFLRHEQIEDAQGEWQKVKGTEIDKEWRGHVGSSLSKNEQVMKLDCKMNFEGKALQRALAMGAEKVIAVLKESGLQGRGGAGFPAAFKWKAVRDAPEPIRYIVLNADEGEPGTFKDRDLLLRRPDLVLEGLAIAAKVLGVTHVYLYMRGAFGGPWKAMEAALHAFREEELLKDIEFHFHAGHGAYICGEETALLEALEGNRGMPRLKPPFPTDIGLWGKPTLIQNVETIACIPSILLHGAGWFKEIGQTEPGSKLYCISGDVNYPGTYEMPLGVTLDDILEVAGGMIGELYAFSPGGASSGFLPAEERNRPLDFSSLSGVGSMLGSAGIVVLNQEADLADAVRDQLLFFEKESCGQCAPCRIGTKFLHTVFVKSKGKLSAKTLLEVKEVAWEMGEGSICGLGQVASLPLCSALKFFPNELVALSKPSEE